MSNTGACAPCNHTGDRSWINPGETGWMATLATHDIPLGHVGGEHVEYVLTQTDRA